MARVSRIKSSIGIYHAMLRGINKQRIFECAEDYEHFVQILQRQCGMVVDHPSNVSHSLSYLDMAEDDASGIYSQRLKEYRGDGKRHCYIYAWCLMDNHVHLLIRENGEEIGDVMKRISSSYVYYYNHKYHRIGHLFQERFKSQPVESWDYFMVLMRYIHQNPLKAHLVDDLLDYRWCSWKEYLRGDSMSISTVSHVFKKISVEELTDQVYKPLSPKEDEGLYDIETKPLKVQKDEEVWRLIESYCDSTNLSMFQALPRPQQRYVLYSVHEEGVGARTLSRLTGVTYSVVQRIMENESPASLSISNSVCEASPEEEEYLSYFENDAFEKYPEWNLSPNGLHDLLT